MEEYMWTIVIVIAVLALCAFLFRKNLICGCGSGTKEEKKDTGEKKGGCC